MPNAPTTPNAAPSSPDTVLGIDLGTSSVKTVVADVNGRIIAQASQEYPVTSARPGWAESEPADWWAAIAATVRAATAQAGAAPTAIGLSGQMHGVVLTAADGHPVRPALLWADARATDYLSAYRRLGPDAVTRLANPLTPGMAGPLLLWIAEHEPDNYARARWALQPKDWVHLRLTGHAAAEPSDASATLLYDIPADVWDHRTIAELGLRSDLFAALAESSLHQAGTLSSAAAAALGLPSGIPVAAGAADTAAAILGSGLSMRGQVQLTVGTGAQLVTLCDAADAEPGAGVHLYRTATRRGCYAMAASVNGGLTLNWVRTILNASWAELYACAAEPVTVSDPIFLPHLVGERTPYLDPSMRGSWAGLGLTHDRTAMLRSALEGVAFAIRDAMDALPGARAVTGLRLAGGGTTDPGWRQMLADVLETPLYALDVTGASGRGAALTGAAAAGFITADDITTTLAPQSRLVAEPDAAHSAAARDRRDTFHTVLHALRPTQ